jgi:hypothetical protein
MRSANTRASTIFRSQSPNRLLSLRLLWLRSRRTRDSAERAERLAAQRATEAEEQRKPAQALEGNIISGGLTAAQGELAAAEVELVRAGEAGDYPLFVRPALHAVPAFKHFFDEADTFWGKVWAMCGKSATVAWGYLLGVLGVVGSLLDPLAQVLGEPNLKAQIVDALKDHPQWGGYFLIGLSAVTIAARMRTVAAPYAVWARRCIWN